MRDFPKGFTQADILVVHLRDLHNDTLSLDRKHDAAIALLTYAEHGKVELSDDDMLEIAHVIMGN